MDAHVETGDLSSQPILRPALQVGATTGGLGLLVGSFLGILRSPSPIIFTVASGLQWFAMGAIFWASRTSILNAKNNRPEHAMTASGLGAALAGAFAGAIARGRRNVLPGAFVFGGLGYVGQYLHNRNSTGPALSQLHGEEASNAKARSKWYPLRMLDDVEYEGMLQEKLIRINSEIALVDEDIDSFRVESAQREVN